ncbi:hypothetical protein MMC17_009593 [Xylographa soralifera]|nr:hypothetical protein [Xylographa soralifera]
MHLYHILFAYLLTLIECAPLPCHSGDLLRSLGLPVDETGATAFSLLYGTPLIQFLQIANGTLHFGESNTLYNHNTTATASTRTVVRPNVDTIYAEAIFDLSATDLVLTLPAMEEDRFYLAAFYDPSVIPVCSVFTLTIEASVTVRSTQRLTFSNSFGDNFASLGSVPASAAGRYLLQSTNSSCVGYEGCITSPTTVGTLLFRVEVKNNSTDVAYVDSYLDSSTLSPINPRTPCLPALTVADFDNLSSSTAVSTLQLTARFESRAIPETALFQAAVPAIFALAGIYDGSYSQPTAANLTLAAALANASMSAFADTPSNYPSLGNGWSVLNSSLIGTYESGMAIIPRALTAIELYLGNTANEALYPTLGTTQLSLTDSEAYLFTFSGKPPIADDGFWSVTMYDTTGYLVANTQNTWAVGDRSNITFPNGDLVYGSGTEDGTFQVLVQDANVPPPSNWTAKYVLVPNSGERIDADHFVLIAGFLRLPVEVTLL